MILNKKVRTFRCEMLDAHKSQLRLASENEPWLSLVAYTSWQNFEGISTAEEVCVLVYNISPYSESQLADISAHKYCCCSCCILSPL